MYQNLSIVRSVARGGLRINPLEEMKGNIGHSHVISIIMLSTL